MSGLADSNLAPLGRAAEFFNNIDPTRTLRFTRQALRYPNAELSALLSPHARPPGARANFPDSLIQGKLAGRREGAITLPSAS